MSIKRQVNYTYMRLKEGLERFPPHVLLCAPSSAAGFPASHRRLSPCPGTSLPASCRDARRPCRRRSGHRPSCRFAVTPIDRAGERFGMVQHQPAAAAWAAPASPSESIPAGEYPGPCWRQASKVGEPGSMACTRKWRLAMSSAASTPNRETQWKDCPL